MICPTCGDRTIGVCCDPAVEDDDENPTVVRAID